MNRMNERTRNKVIEIARRAGFVVQLKPNGDDLYEKNMVFRHGGIKQTVYVRKDRGMDSDGDAKEYIVAIHPDFFRDEFSNSARGYARITNRRTGRYIFASSNYTDFPYCENPQQRCGQHIKADSDIALAELFTLLAGHALSGETLTDHSVAQYPDKSAGETPPNRNKPAASAPEVAGELSGLIIRREPLQSILRGEKCWEMRSKHTHKRGRIALIEKGSGQVVGVAELVDSIGPLSEEQMRANQDKHRIRPERLNSGEVSKWRIAWVLKNVQPLETPVSYQHKSGAVTWVTLTSEVSDAVWNQLQRQGV